jgi:outer membrane protein OmpA-like peptidoglycan-associated protein
MLSLLAACGSDQPPLMKRVEDDKAPPPQVPIEVAVPKPAKGAEGGPAATASTRGLVAPASPVSLAPDTSVIYFGVDRYQVDEAYAPLLKAHAKRLLSDPAQLLRIDAFTDPTGPADYNLELSRMRAQTVLRELRALGVPARQLQVVGHGPERKRGRAGHARRVELNYR